MKKILSLLFCLITLSTAIAQQHGSISGVVTATDGSPVGYVSVGLKGTSYGASTNDKGRFRIGRINPGTYMVTVSAINITTQEKQVTITAGQAAEVNFILDISTSQLQEVIINSNNNRIKIDNPSPSLRLNEPLLEVPQNIQVVSSQALAQQQIISVSDGLVRNVSGAIRLEHWGDMYANINMRGSQIQAFRNGFNIVNSYWGPLTEDMSFVDHIEFVKGPAGFMLANGDPSGLYNVVTKKPTGQTKGEFSYTTGSFNLNRATLDLDGKLSKDGKLLYRLNLAGQNKGSFRANEFNDRYSIAPVISYQVDDKTKLTAEYIYQRAHMSDVGSFYIFSPDGYATYPQNTSALPAGLPPTNINDHSITFNLQHQLSTNWKLTAQTAYYNYGMKGSSLWAEAIDPDGKYIRDVGQWDAKSKMTLGQVFLNGKAYTGSVTHNILAGLDVGSKDYAADFVNSQPLDTEDQKFDPKNPNLGFPPNGFPVFDRTLSLDERAAASGGLINQRYSGVYVQDELGFLDNKLRLTLAGRYTYVNQSSFGSAAEIAKHFTPRIGLSASIDDQTSVYGLYDQAFTPQSGRLAGGGSVKPLTGNNLEFGVKRDWAHGTWNTTVSVYRILKNNELTAAPNTNPTEGLSVVLGQKRAQGVEFDLRGQILPGLDVTANYAYTDSKVTKLADQVEGITVPAYAKHVANAWINYKLLRGTLKGAGIAGGFTFLGNRQADAVTPIQMADYFKVDGGLFWEGSKMRIAANVFNVLNKYLYSGSYYVYLPGYYYQAEAPRNYRLSVTYKF
ncbi:TonB-dependent siderophore receptor [Mucilaginibacter litoreus]|uniref:TonB-dependent siderophore receptor n=1 Tax=Mucilaginibacter litoreus TaxID=1048221 RepID=A0ABW3AWI2_9SPHI